MKVALFLHGFLSDPVTDFQKYIDKINDMRIYDKIVTVSFPGHSSDPTKLNYWNFYGIDTILKVERIVSELSNDNANNVDLYGYSLGGAIAMYIASQEKYRINKLILLAPAYKYINNYMFRNKIKFSFKYVFDKKNRNRAKEQLRIARENDYKATKFFIKKYFKLYIAKAYHEFKSIISFVQRNTLSINAKTLICYGTLDQLVPIKSINGAYNKVTNDKKILKIYENMTHLMLASVNPEEVIKDIIDFIGDDYESE